MAPGSDEQQRRADSLRVLQIVMEEYVGSGPPAEASVLTSGWGRQVTWEDGARTRAAVGELQDVVLGPRAVGNLASRLAGQLVSLVLRRGSPDRKSVV